MDLWNDAARAPKLKTHLTDPSLTLTDTFDQKALLSSLFPIKCTPQELAAGFVDYWQTIEETGKFPDNDKFANCMEFASRGEPFELCLDAIEIIVEKHSESKAYEQVLIGTAVTLFDALAEKDTKLIETHLKRIADSPALNKVAFNVYTNLFDDKAISLLNRLRTNIAKKRKWLEMPSDLALKKNKQR